jgi:hypothetical protein
VLAHELEPSIGISRQWLADPVTPVIRLLKALLSNTRLE